MACSVSGMGSEGGVGLVIGYMTLVLIMVEIKDTIVR
jgi:ABC-type glucose/galactose transport system permease subunit